MPDYGEGDMTSGDIHTVLRVVKTCCFGKKTFVLRYYCEDGWSENVENLLYPANATQRAKRISQDLPKENT